MRRQEAGTQAVGSNQRRFTSSVRPLLVVGEGREMEPDAQVKEAHTTATEDIVDTLLLHRHLKRRSGRIAMASPMNWHATRTRSMPFVEL